MIVKSLGTMFLNILVHFIIKRPSSTKSNNNTITAQKKVIFTTEIFIPNIVGPNSEATER